MQGVPLRKEKLDKFFANEGYLHHFDLKFEDLLGIARKGLR
jgi:hypothetical protein